MIKVIIKEIMLTAGLNIEAWNEIFRKNPNGRSISNSSISNWRQGKQKMGKHYIKIFIESLCEQEELRIFESAIRKRVMEFLKIKQYQKLYWDLNRMSYKEFLIYVLQELNWDNMCKCDYSWNEIPLAVLMDLCVQKARALYDKLQIWVEKENEGLLLTYKHGNGEKYKVIVGFLLGDKEIKQKCVSISAAPYLIKYLFVTQDVSDELYLEMLEKNNTFILKIDFYDLEDVKVLENYIVENHSMLDEQSWHFMNLIAELVLRKISEMNHVILKEILYSKFDCRKVDQQFFASNEGIWRYRYPVRRALAFEEKLIKQKIRMAAKGGRSELQILDIDLTDGLLGIRCSFGAGNVTNVGVSLRGLKTVKNIIQRYNEEKGAENEGIYNVNCAYLRLDTMKIIGAKVPEKGYDLIILGLGGGSYIPDLDGFLRQLSMWLKNGKKDRNDEGVILLSVFNRDALCFSASQAKMDFKYDYGCFRHVEDEWLLPAKLYGYKEICRMAMKHYDLLERYSYPTVLSVVSENYQKEILEKLKEIDKDYAYGDMESANRGLFHTLFLKKIYLEEVSQSYFDIKKYISEQDIVLQTIQHEEITSRSKMVRELNRHDILAGDNFIKTVVVIDERYDILVFCLLPLYKKFKKEWLKTWYDKEKIEMVRRTIRLCTENELREMGLTSGSVSPFSYPVISKIEQKHLICDEEIKYSTFQTLYTYSGDLEITYKIGKDSFLSFLKMNNVVFI